jgi:hypothetical protein
MKLLFPCSATTLACGRASMMVAACRIGDGIKGPTGCRRLPSVLPASRVHGPQCCAGSSGLTPLTNSSPLRRLPLFSHIAN